VVDYDPVTKLIFMYYVLYANILLDIEQVEILRKVKRVAEKLSKSLVSDGRV
jgi:hypothetical protein